VVKNAPVFIPLVAALSLGIAAGPDAVAVREEAYRANNVGIGLLEQYLYDDAVAAFRRALEADPSLVIAKVNLAVALFYVPDLESARKEAEAAAALAPTVPQPHYILGLVAKGQNRPADAMAAFQKVLALDAADVGANVNLGQIHLQQRRYPEAVAALRTAVASDAFNSSALYNLGIALTRSGQTEEGQKVLERFETLRKSGTAIVFGQTYPDQGRYAEALASTGAEPELVDARPPAVRFVDATAAFLPGEARSAPATTRSGRVTLFDLDGDADLDLLDVGQSGQRLLRNHGGRLLDVTKAMGLDPAAAAIGAVAGDLDNDGKPELLAIRDEGPTLHHNDGEKGFSDVTSAAGLKPGPAASSAALVDVDHDGDLDVVLAGGSAGHRLLRNDGKAVFAEITEAAGLPASRAPAVAIVPTDFDNHRDVDILVVGAEAPPLLLKNLRDGSFRDVAVETGLAKAEGPFVSVAAADVNKDGYTDFFLGRAKATGLLALSDGKMAFAVGPVAGSEGAASAQFFDYDNDGLLDLVSVSSRGVHVFRNVGGGRWSDVSAAAVPKGTAAESVIVGDVDGDGASDLVLRLRSGALRLLRNEGGRNHSLRVLLAGRVSNRNGVGAKVDIRAGSLRQKLETSATTPAVAAADLVFGLGPREAADAVRVIWPAGILQTETDPAKIAVRSASLEELDRKPSSCPYLYAWNGERFDFVTDFMGGGEMGYNHGAGVWNTPIPEEYVRLSADQLRPRDGRYELRVTNELEEAMFVDRLRLVAVAHPRDTLVFPNEGMAGAPRPPLRLFAVRDLRPPARAVDDQGRDVQGRLAHLDRKYVDGFPLEAIRGYAKDHALILDIGDVPPEHALLLLTAWTDYSFSSDNVAAGQRGLAAKPPSLEVQDDQGRWVTAIANIGIPVGRPQTVVVDLAGKWLGPRRSVRIATNMRIYWDQALVGTSAGTSLRRADLDPGVADLRDRGFSAEVTPDGREPFSYDYTRVSRVSPWKAFPGRYTRTGDVRELLAASDDVFVISRPGDEIALSFEASALPPLPEGWTRTFLLHADGFSKEMDINSATPHTLGPLPFHGMSRYPYEAPEAYPMTPEKLALMERYNTRQIVAPVASLEVALTERPAREAGDPSAR
jgi:tetratricopeptide (TPR) repeat protein